MSCTPDALLDLDTDQVLRDAVEHYAQVVPAEQARHRAARRRNRAAAFLFLQSAGRRGVTSEDPKSEAILAAFRRDALREAGVDERLVRRGAA